MLKILIIDDETNIRKTLGFCLSGDGHEFVAVGNSKDALEEARKSCFDMALLDLRLGEDNGMDLIPLLVADSPWMKIVIITAHASISSAVEAIKLGAFDYLPKPFSPDQVRIVSTRIEKLRCLEKELNVLKNSTFAAQPDSMSLESKCPGMQRVIETARKAAQSDATVLLLGESGTGKSVFARAIHEWSNRSERQFGVVACPAIPSELIESELFGHAKGAFTGAIKDNQGKIAYCEGGTLFLDEIGDLAMPLQSKLLRFLQEREYERIGENNVRRANVRIIAATNADLAKLVAEGRFREDLFYRLNVIPLTIFPLRERPEDVMGLAIAFLKMFCRANSRSLPSISDEAEKLLFQHSWPGNIRELKNTIERAVILGNGREILAADLSGIERPKENQPGIGDRISLEKLQEMHIRKVLANQPSLKEAAEILDIDQATLWRKRKCLGI